MTNPNPIDDFLITSADEFSYAKENGLVLHKLSNKAIILGAYRGANDSMYASINLHFKTGAYFDPPDKSGLHHLLEHFFHKSEHLEHLYKVNNINWQASTSYVSLVAFLGGTYNSNSPQYGISPILEQAINQICQSSKSITDEKILKNEKRIVLSEIYERQASHDWLVDYHIDQTFLAKDNPRNTNTPGTPQTLDNIKLEDINDLAKKILHPSNMIVSILHENSFKQLQALTDQTKQILIKTSASQSVGNKIDSNLFNLMNKIDFEYLEINTELKNKVISICFSYQLQPAAFSTMWAAWRGYQTEIAQVFYFKLRKLGLAYTIRTNIIGSDENQRLIVHRLDIRAPESRIKLEKIIKKCRLVSMQSLKLNKGRMIELIEGQKRMKSAEPIDAHSRLNWMVTGLKEYDRVLDVDKVMKFYSKMKLEDFQYWQHTLKKQIPVTIVIGDLSFLQ